MKHETELKNNTERAVRISVGSIVANAALTVIKLAAALLAGSAALLSDAVHSATDAVSSVAVIVSVKLSSRGADHDHEYGHERLEAIGALLMAVALALTGAGIGWSGLQAIISGSAAQLEAPGVLALVAAALSIVVKEAMYQITAKAAREIDSTALMADAWHHRSDALSSIGSLAGILAARLGWPWGDPLASVLISLMIIKAGIDIFRTAAEQLTDKACDPQLEQEIRATILQVHGVERVDLLQTRQFAARVYADVEIAADGSMSLTQAHEIAENVHDVIEKQYPSVKHCMVHVNPA